MRLSFHFNLAQQDPLQFHDYPDGALKDLNQTISVMNKNIHTQHLPTISKFHLGMRGVKTNENAIIP